MSCLQKTLLLKGSAAKTLKILACVPASPGTNGATVLFVYWAPTDVCADVCAARGLVPVLSQGLPWRLRG